MPVSAAQRSARRQWCKTNLPRGPRYHACFDIHTEQVPTFASRTRTKANAGTSRVLRKASESLLEECTRCKTGLATNYGGTQKFLTVITRKGARIVRWKGGKTKGSDMKEIYRKVAQVTRRLLGLPRLSTVRVLMDNEKAFHSPEGRAAARQAKLVRVQLPPNSADLAPPDYAVHPALRKNLDRRYAEASRRSNAGVTLARASRWAAEFARGLGEPECRRMLGALRKRMAECVKAKGWHLKK